jgi:hypothetical protein
MTGLELVIAARAREDRDLLEHLSGQKVEVKEKGHGLQ